MPQWKNRHWVAPVSLALHAVPGATGRGARRTPTRLSAPSAGTCRSRWLTCYSASCGSTGLVGNRPPLIRRPGRAAAASRSCRQNRPRRRRPRDFSRAGPVTRTFVVGRCRQAAAPPPHGRFREPAPLPIVRRTPVL